MGSYFLVVNPQSANGSTGRRWPQILAEVKSRLGTVDFAFTESVMHATGLTSQALKKGYDCVVAVGGDGTLNEVVNGFFEERRLIRPQATLGLLPLGTGGDFRRSLGLEGSLSQMLERLSAPNSMPMDVGFLEYTHANGQKGTRYFANVASFGVSGQVAVEVNQASKWLGGRWTFMLGSARALLKYTDRRVRLTLDGKALDPMPVTTVAVANGKYFGGGMKVAPSAELSDGLFEVTVWQGYGLSDFLLKGKAIYDGSHVRMSGTRQYQCRTLWAESEEDVLIDVDGEQPGRLPCRIEVMPSALRVKGAA